MSTIHAEPLSPTPLAPTWVRMLVLLVSAVQVATVLPGLWIATVGAGQVLWTTVGFEVVALGAGIAGVMIGLGRVREGVGLGLLCAAGAILVTGVFGLHLAAGPTLNSATLAGDASASAGKVLGLVVKGRVLLFGAVSLLAALSVLTRSARSWRPLGLGLALLLPVLAIGVWLVGFGGAGTMVGDIETGVGVARLIGTLFGGLVLFIIASIGGHFIIRAFEIAGTKPSDGSTDSNGPSADAPAGAKPAAD